MSMGFNVCLAGATGWIGRPLSFAIASAGDMNFVGAVSRKHSGKRLKDVLTDLDADVMVSGSVGEALQTQTDVLVDYTSPEIVKPNVMAAVRKGVHVVIGTSGLTDQDFVEINEAALDQNVGVIAAGNFAITAVLLERFAREAARYLPHWEIIDYASAGKVDAPSGVSRELAFRLREIRRPEMIYPVEKTIGARESRGAELNGSRVHSLRLPGYTIALEIIFGAADERLAIRHDAGSGAEPYLSGTLLAIRKVKDHVGLRRSLDNLLE
jgi:4-hydroxy-tetrahydrodipicolinate reductase